MTGPAASGGAPRTIGGLPFHLLPFDADGRLTSEGGAAAVADRLASDGTTDLLLLAHGWNADRAGALAFYRRFLAETSRLLREHAIRPGVVAGYAGLLWPSLHLPDDVARDRDPPDGDPADDGPPGDDQPDREALRRLIDHPAPSEASLETFVVGLRELARREAPAAGDEPAGGVAAPHLPSDPIPPEDSLERDGLLAGDWRDLLATLADAGPPAPDEGGAAGTSSPARLRRGARRALRILGYWSMKRRAGIVGQDGLGPLLGELAAARPGLRVHLVGHSFGARLVSYALKGLPAHASGDATPVKSLLLLQGAFSHYAFARALPHDPRRGGHLRGMAARVDGPLLATHSRHDRIIRLAYRLASVLARQDASLLRDPLLRWGAMGDRGAQAVDAASATLGPPGTHYPFAPGRWINLDGDAVIRRGGPPAGAHRDVVHPHTAWAALAAARLLRDRPGDRFRERSPAATAG